jgi:hypothetical protein
MDDITGNVGGVTGGFGGIVKDLLGLAPASINSSAISVRL